MRRERRGEHWEASVHRGFNEGKKGSDVKRSSSSHKVSDGGSDVTSGLADGDCLRMSGKVCQSLIWSTSGLEKRGERTINVRDYAYQNSLLVGRQRRHIRRCWILHRRLLFDRQRLLDG